MTGLQPSSQNIQKQRLQGEIDVTRSEAGLAVSEKVYWETYYDHPDFSYEWNNGRLEEKPVSDHLTYLMYLWVLRLLDHFLMVHPIGQMVGLEMGFRLALPDKTTVRKPDLAVVLNDNPIAIHPHDRSYSGIFDLCVEALSDSTPEEVERDTVTKKNEYAIVGVREYYILDAKGQETAFYHRDQRGRYEKIKSGPNELIQSQVLPGFQFRISDLYRQPTLQELAEDDLYRGFILPFYQAEKQRAERLAAKLRSLGISPEED